MAGSSRAAGGQGRVDAGLHGDNNGLLGDPLRDTPDPTPSTRRNKLNKQAT